MRFRIATLLLATLVAALVVRFGPLLLTQEEALDEPTQGTGKYVLFEDTRAMLTDKDLDLAAFPATLGAGNLVWIEHTCSLVDPNVIGGWSSRKILIQLPSQIGEGSEFEVRLQGRDLNSTAYTSPNTTPMSDGLVDVHVFNEPSDLYWMSEHIHLDRVYREGYNTTCPPIKIGSVEILKMTPKTVDIMLDLPSDITIPPEAGAVPRKITLIRKKQSAR